MDKDRRVAILRTVFWIAIVISFLAAINPQPPQLPGAPNDKVQHIAAFLLLGALAFFAFPGAKRWTLLIGLSAFGALIEFTQLIPALNRDGDPVDWIADTAAAGLMLILLHWLRARRVKPAAGNS